MNKQLMRSGSKVVKTSLKVSFIMIMMGLLIGTYGLSQANLAGNYYEIDGYQVQEQYLGYFDLGEDVQVAISGSYDDEIDNRFDGDYQENFLEIVLLHSTSRDFSSSDTVYHVESSELYRDFSADDGYYKLIITNLSGNQINYVVIEAHSSTSTLATIVVGLALVGFGFAIIAMTIGIVFHVLFILGVIYLVRAVIEKENRKKQTIAPQSAPPSGEYAGYMVNS